MSPEALESAVLRFGVFELDPRTGELRKGGTLIRLQPQPFKVLVLLAGRAGDLVTRDELQQQIWGDSTFVDFEQGLNHCIKQIRLALSDDAETPRYIETLPRRGYRFVAPVTKADGAKPVPAAATEASPRTPSSIRAAQLVTIAPLLVLLAIGVFLLQRSFWPSRGAASARVMLAVLPFENLSGDPEQEYFSDGLTDEMITQLGSVQPKRLGVIARTSAMRYRRTEKTATEIGRELGVDYILEGTVRREGGRVRITAQLIQARDQTSLWAESYEQQLASVFEIQKEVSQRVARSLALELLPGWRASPGPPGTPHPEALEAYLKGRYFSHKGIVREALQSFFLATRADPGYAQAYAALSDSLVFASPAVEFMPRARGAALRALELNPNLPEAHSALGLVKLMYEWDWPGAEREFLRALELDPNNAETRLRYSNYLAAMGRLDEAIDEGRRAQRLDPLSPLIGQQIGRYFHFQRQPARAIEQYKKTLELDPDFRWSHRFLAFEYGDAGQYELWLAEEKRTSFLFNGSTELGDRLEAAFRRGGYPAAVREIISANEEAANRGQMASAALVFDYAKIGDKEKALYWLEKAYQNHTRDLIYLNVEPSCDSIRSDPRFQEIVHKIGLPPVPGAKAGK